MDLRSASDHLRSSGVEHLRLDDFDAGFGGSDAEDNNNNPDSGTYMPPAMEGWRKFKLSADSQPHWAPAGAKLINDGPPHRWAPRAGGEKKAPPPAADWEWDLVTTISAGEAPPSPGSASTRVHKGGCHCGAVRFEVIAPPSLVVWECNCTDCRMRRNLHFVVPKSQVRLIEEEGGRGSGGATALAEYRWGMGQARHLFCARCGVCPFYQPRSNPDGWAITFPCLDGGTVSSVEVRQFDGLHWEEFYAGQGAAIKAFSVEGGGGKSEEPAASAAAEVEKEPPPRLTPWLWLILKAVAALLLPFVIAMLAVWSEATLRKDGSWALPGRPQPD